MIGSRLLFKTFTRFYRIPALKNLDPHKGLQGLLSQEGLKRAWFDRASYYVQKLNENSEGREKTIESILEKLSNISSKRTLYNWASQLYNLNFAFSRLKGNSRALPEIKIDASALLKVPSLALSYVNEPLDLGHKRLHQSLIQSFGSLPEFKALLLNSNQAISGDGYTWLVARKSQEAGHGVKVFFDKLFIVNTYNSGSPYNLNKSENFKQLEAAFKTNSNIIDKINSARKEAIMNATYKENVSYIPLLAIDASPKTWLHDYGVFGKQEYLERVWESIDWSVVETNLPLQHEAVKFSF